MKSTGIVRKVDELGRVVIPIDIYRGFGIMGGDEVEIFANEDGIIIKKHEKDDIVADITSVIRKYESDGKNYETIKALEKLVKNQKSNSNIEKDVV